MTKHTTPPASPNDTSAAVIDTFLARSFLPTHCDATANPPCVTIDTTAPPADTLGANLAALPAALDGAQPFHLFVDAHRLIGFVDVLLPGADTPWYVALDAHDAAQRALLEVLGKKRKLQLVTTTGQRMAVTIAALRASQWRLLRMPVEQTATPLLLTAASADPTLDTLIQQYGPFLLALAYTGYTQLGRGGLLIDDMGAYYGVNYTVPGAGAPTLRAATNAYDPERQMVVVLNNGVEPVPLAVLEPADPSLWPSRVEVRPSERPPYIKKHARGPHWRLEKPRLTPAG